MSSVLEIVIFVLGLLFSMLAHIVAWTIYAAVSKVLDRLRQCDDNIKSASKLLDYSAITGSVLQLGADPLRYDPDVNEFERDVALLMLKDPQLSYTGETMSRPNKPAMKPPEPPAEKTEKPLFGRSKMQPKSEPEKEEPPKDAKEPKMPEMPGPTIESKENAEPEAAAKKKFKPPPNITKADAKDPQYETLRGIGNELFAVEKEKEEKEKKKEEGKDKDADQNKKEADKIKFKEPAKIQKADAKDPQYETLADVKDDIFKG